MKTYVAVAVAILTRDRLPRLQATVEAVLAQLGAGDSLAVADTGSRDGTRGWLAEITADRGDSRFRWFTLDGSKLDFGAARDAIAGHPDGGCDPASAYDPRFPQRIVLFLDDDCIPAPDTLARVRAAWDLNRPGSFAPLIALGGLALPPPDLVFPRWWNPDLAWTVGLATPGQAARQPDHYPTTSIMAIHAGVMQMHRYQFGSSGPPLSSPRRYLGGREDADWWRRARIRGDNVRIDPGLTATHFINPARLAWRAVMARARNDGRAAAAREARPAAPGLRRDLARDAARESGAAVVSAAFELARAPWHSGAVPDAAAAWVWSARQAAFARAAGGVWRVPADMLSGAAREVRRRAAGAFHGRRGLINADRFRPPAVPRRVLVAAPTFLGDSILLQCAVRAFARSYPACRIDVWTTFPGFFHDIAPNVESSDSSQTDVVPLARAADAVFAPYFHRAPSALWRRHMAAKGVTFDRDVGFPRDRDHALAARRVTKDFGLHETANLARLFSHVWPVDDVHDRPSVAVDPAASAALLAEFPALADGPFFTIQPRSGHASKDWPADRWADLAKRTAGRTGWRLVVPHSPAEAAAAAEIVALSGLAGALAVPGDIDRLTAVLSMARLALGHCSGPKHLAMALGTPTFTVYGPSHPVRWGAFDPDDPDHRWVLSPAHGLTAREHAGLPVDHIIRLVSVRSAWRALRPLMDRLAPALPDYESDSET